MRLVTFLQDGQPRLGALVERPEQPGVLDLNLADPRLPADMLAFLEAGAPARDLAAAALLAPLPLDVRPLGAVTLKAPVLRPGKIICIGQNYLEHARESNAPGPPPYPIIFAKFANAVIGPGEAIVIPKATQKPDYEGELGVVIGRRARNVREADALDYVAGYLCVNDVSARDIQNRTSQWVLGKTPDTFCPLGPALVTTDEIADVQNLTLRTVIGDEVLQEGCTRAMIFSVAHLIWDMARVMTLEPGDVIATGTPSGIGAARTPPRWLRPGETIRVEISGIGVLANPIVAEA